MRASARIRGHNKGNRSEAGIARKRKSPLMKEGRAERTESDWKKEARFGKKIVETRQLTSSSSGGGKPGGQSSTRPRIKVSESY